MAIISLQPSVVTEPTTGSTTITITLTRDDTEDTLVEGIYFDGADFNSAGTADGDDYVYSEGLPYYAKEVAFPAGSATATVNITINSDSVREDVETIRVGYYVRGDESIITIATLQIRDSSATVTPSLSGDNGTGAGGSYIPGAFYGTEGADLILTRDAPGIFVGNGGNDTYLVNGSTDTVIEAAGGGTDIVYSTASFTLGSAEVEAISTVQQTDTTAINLIGNYVSQTIVGNYGNNILNGGGGQDRLIGLFGDDTYAIGDSRTVIQEQAGEGNDTLVTSVDYRLSTGVSIEVIAAQDASSTTGLRLTGNELAQTIAGTAGADTIGGGGGRDVLIGGAGADTFVIGTVATGNVAVLADYAAGTDRIGLTSTAFNVGTGLDAAEFVAGTAAATADQRVIYDAGTGQLFYDADGNGAGAAILFAQVVPGTAITAASFDVIVPTATAG